MSVRTRTVFVLSSLAPVPRLCRRRKVGGGRGALSFVFVASLSVRPQFRRWPSSTGSLLLSLSAVCLAFGSLSFVLREGGHRGSGAIVASAVLAIFILAIIRSFISIYNLIVLLLRALAAPSEFLLTSRSSGLSPLLALYGF